MQKHFGLALQVGRFIGESIGSAYSGWGIRDQIVRDIKERSADQQFSNELSDARELAAEVAEKRSSAGFRSDDDVCRWSIQIVDQALQAACGSVPHDAFRDHLIGIIAQIARYEGWFFVPQIPTSSVQRSDLWEWEDHVRRVGTFCDRHEEASALIIRYLTVLIGPLVQRNSGLLLPGETQKPAISFNSDLLGLLENIPERVEEMLQVSFSPELTPLKLCQQIRARLNHNLIIASGGIPGKELSARQIKLPTKNKSISDHDAAKVYLGGTPLQSLLNFPVPVTLPNATRFEHMHIVAGSGHGKTQTLQHLILRDLEAVAAGSASIIVIDSQSDLINNIAGLDAFAPGGALADRLVHIDPTDIEWPVALNLFDAGLERLDQYAPLDRERLTNSILELYDFVLGSLLDAGMTQKQNVIFRYITRLLLHIPGATIHTLRELLEDGGALECPI